MDDRYDIRAWIARQTRQQLNWYPPGPTDAERRRILDALLLGLHGEVGEIHRRLHTGPHILRSPPIEAAGVAHEVVDTIKYALAIAATAGVDPETLVETFWSVTEAVDDRWRCERAALEGELVLVVDVDGCLADFDEGYKRWFESQPIATKFDISELNAHWMEKHKQRFYASGGFAGLAPLSGAAQVVRDFAAKGVKIVIITARPKRRHKNVETDTIAWLRRHRIPYNLLLFDRDKAEALSEHVLPARVIAAVEDRHKHAVEIAALGIPVILFPSAVDTGEAPDDPLIHPVGGWAEARRAVASLHKEISRRWPGKE